jgi:hypothetical protein
MSDLRAGGDRQRLFIMARIRFGAGALSTPCHVRDLSETGARISVDPQVTIPDHFTLEVPSRDLTHQCEMRWRAGKEIGVRFVNIEKALTPEERIAELEAENEKLRLQVRKLKIELGNRMVLDD